MLRYPEIDPVAIAIGPVKIHWYGIMYLIGFAGVWLLGQIRAKRDDLVVKRDMLDDLVFYGAMGAILGGRIGYILFYHFDYFLDDPLILIKIWQGGMSFHGGMLGVFVAMALFARKYQLKTLAVIDFLTPMAPIGLFTGRIGNFINGELWGRPTDVPWAMIFPRGGPIPRHPSQLYEAFLEGVVLFGILWVYSMKPRPIMTTTGMGLFWYGVFRIFVEFYRVPDAHLGYLALNWLTMGQILSLPMVIIGAILIGYGYREHR